MTKRFIYNKKMTNSNNADNDGDDTVRSKESNHSELKEEIRAIWREFLNETTLHGCRCILSSPKHWIRRYLWLAAVTVCTVFLLVYINNFFTFYKTNPFITKTKRERVKSMPFSAISICDPRIPKDHVKNSEMIADDIVSKTNFVRQFLEYNTTDTNKLFTEEVMKHFDTQNGYNIEDLILKADVGGRNIDIKHEFRKSTGMASGCFIFNGIQVDGTGGHITLSQGQSLSLILNMSQDTYFPLDDSAGIKLKFHDPRDKPTSITPELDVAPGFTTSISLIPTKMKFLPKPYTSYGEDYCVNSMDTSTIGMRWHEEYTWAGCIEECIIVHTISHCKCRPQLSAFSEFESTSEICTDKASNRCVIDFSERMYEDILAQNDTLCNCLQPCEFIQYDIRTSLKAFPSKPTADFLVRQGVAPSYQNMRDNYLSVNIKFERMILQHVEHVPEIDSSNILSMLGGQMGLFLGASVLTLTEITESILLSVFVLAKAFLKPWTGQKIGTT